MAVALLAGAGWLLKSAWEETAEIKTRLEQVTTAAAKLEEARREQEVALVAREKERVKLKIELATVRRKLKDMELSDEKFRAWRAAMLPESVIDILRQFPDFVAAGLPVGGADAAVSGSAVRR